MTDPGVEDLHYGHFGQAIYDVDNKTWAFKRVPGIRRVFHPLGRLHTEIPATASESSFSVSPATRLDAQRKHLLSLNPELRAAASLLGRAAQVSDAVNAVASNFDPLAGDLLACGRAGDVDNKGSKGTVRIAALPAGPAGDALRLVRLDMEQHGWSSDKSVWLRVPSLQHGDVGWWAGSGAPILQICCACQDDERSTFLAVRTARSVHLFQPLYHRVPVPPKDSSSPRLFPPSRLEASLLESLNLPSDSPGFADVAFNPWYQRQFATLDQEGNWNVYDIEGRRWKGQSGHSTILTKHGCFEFPLDASDIQAGTLAGPYDGWGRVLWASDVSTILVCNRRAIQFVDFQDRSVFLTPSSLRLAHSTSWILDVRRDPRESSHILVLTSTHLLVLRAPNLKKYDQGKKIDADILLSWRHFLNEEDLTMQLFPFVDGEDIVVLLRSKCIQGFIAFRYRRHVDLDLLVSVSDPAWLFRSIEPGAVRGIHMDALEFGQDSRAAISGPGYGYMERGVQFFSVHVLSQSLEASRVLAFACNDVPGQLAERQASVECPSQIRNSNTRSSTRVLDDSFVVPDDAEELEGEPRQHHWRRRRAARRSVRPFRRDYSRIYEVIGELNKLSKEDALDVIAELRTDIASIDADEGSQDTLHHLASLDYRLDVSDIDKTSAAFSELVTTTFKQDGEEAFLAIKPIQLASLHEEVAFEDGYPSVSLTLSRYGVQLTSGHNKVRDLPPIGKQVLSRWRIGEEYRTNRDENNYIWDKGRPGCAAGIAEEFTDSWICPAIQSGGAFFVSAGNVDTSGERDPWWTAEEEEEADRRILSVALRHGLLIVLIVGTYGRVRRCIICYWFQKRQPMAHYL
ncbi:RNA polymerase I-specific transcription initiation factor RRN6-like protein [Macrophomina phaseolina MS6]|uniref:RNA polymerase I-specific transcription initiation factor RRN6-like protein n=1 Tax=Macrophomina phaseolina (strain MS6) TaxID=1126212 RepID=K2S275_MACPH|nr:RNA polymerase I-specific transcription initiation factor RRN6-like protein [Macrophomina phaseolina MS6]